MRDQFQISPAASPEVLCQTVWRTWLFIAYSDDRWLILSTSHSSLKVVGRMYVWTWEWWGLRLGSSWKGLETVHDEKVLTFKSATPSRVWLILVTPRNYVFDVTSLGQRSSPWTCNSVKAEITFHLEYKLPFPSAELMLRPHGKKTQFRRVDPGTIDSGQTVS